MAVDTDQKGQSLDRFWECRLYMGFPWDGGAIGAVRDEELEIELFNLALNTVIVQLFAMLAITNGAMAHGTVTWVSGGARVITISVTIAFDHPSHKSVSRGDPREATNLPNVWSGNLCQWQKSRLRNVGQFGLVRTSGEMKILAIILLLSKIITMSIRNKSCAGNEG